MLLAIDTATQLSSIALYDGRNLLAEDTWTGASNHSTELAPAVRRLLARADVPVERLTALAVCIGPGAYTGLRIGVALAKGIASARQLPLVGMTTMEILAAAQPQFNGGLVTVVQAGRGRIITQTHQWRTSRWSARGEAQIMDWETLVKSIDGPAWITGEVDEAGFEALIEAEHQGVPVTLAPAALRLRRAGFLAQEAWAKLQVSPGDFPADRVVPVYVQTKDTP
ncbi:MAG: tRNA (adenosine(37)-N6)-threonylcarbamoyltransferase complex dimerization subunit type 1 TsaB [Chloroflexota bacterium]|nr:MAG: tRNA (adenosine(37)-N6)-threonylcarbamoyltransferase complex dimerization subunit type 1 TsaB [Chloroflexota bacterium]